MEGSTCPHPREDDTGHDGRSVRQRVGDDTDQPAAAAASFAVSGGAAHTLAVGLQDGKPRLLAFGWDCRRQCGLGSTDELVECVLLLVAPRPPLAAGCRHSRG